MAADATGRGFRVLRANGVQSEARLPFAALHQILHPLAAHTAALPEIQQTAIAAAFGQVDAAAPAPYLVALAALGLLCGGAADTPLVVLVDDAHWLDAASAGALAFVARRLQADPVLLLAAVRGDYDSGLLDAQLPVIPLTGIDAGAAEQLLRTRHPGLSEQARAEVLRTAQGNPLALVELPSTIDKATAAPHILPLTDRLERSFAARLRELSRATQKMLTLCAADDGSSLREVLTASARMLSDPAATAENLTPAIDAGLIDLADDRVTFRHPLARSAIYQAASRQDRLAAHSALAQILVDDPERRAWHLAAGSVGQDESVAAAMEQAAVAAARRGSHAVSATAWQRAAALSPDPRKRSTRYLHAAELVVELGQPDRAAQLIDNCASDLPTLGERARAVLVRDAVDPGMPGDPTRVRMLVDLAESVRRTGDTELVIRLLLAAAGHTWSADPGQEARERLIAEVQRLPVPTDDPLRLTILGFTDPAGQAAAIRERVARIRREDLDAGASALVTSVFLVSADPALAALQANVIDNLRAAGRFRALPHALSGYAWQAIALADWKTALPAADECHRVAVETGQPLWSAASMLAQAMIAAMRSDSETAERLAAQAEAIVLPLRMNPVLCGLQFVRGISSISTGRYDAAFSHLARTANPADPAFHTVQSTWVLGDLAEAAAATGRIDEARELISQLATPPGTAASPWTEAAALYARPFLAQGDAADLAFQEVLASELSRWPSYRARLLLQYGMWLRRRRRIADARRPLRAARDACTALGLTSWAATARRELRAAGEESQNGRDALWTLLSAQELQIAQLAAAGHSNREIAQRLYLSERTVASHLYRLYPKLGITSRTKLHSVLGSTPIIEPLGSP
ncbi:LuxR family transcriptional regulator [Dactylosporangium salmoneum]|uniref:LuxR family transcriptional regulator n=1 Tax=Dactylosporangium salmoneum TaxID=53361 RepID=A0ABN3GUC0_9ACTN